MNMYNFFWVFNINVVLIIYCNSTRLRAHFYFARINALITKMNTNELKMAKNSLQSQRPSEPKVNVTTLKT